MNNYLPYSETNIVDLSKELVNKVLSKKIYDVEGTLTEGIEGKKRIIFFLLDGLGNHQLSQNKGILFNNINRQVTYILTLIHISYFSCFFYVEQSRNQQPLKVSLSWGI